jgi:hypothetical protein
MGLFFTLSTALSDPYTALAVEIAYTFFYNIGLYFITKGFIRAVFIVLFRYAPPKTKRKKGLLTIARRLWFFLIFALLVAGSVVAQVAVGTARAAAKLDVVGSESVAQFPDSITAYAVRLSSILSGSAVVALMATAVVLLVVVSWELWRTYLLRTDDGKWIYQDEMTSTLHTLWKYPRLPTASFYLAVALIPSIVTFLIPATATACRIWTVTDPTMAVFVATGLVPEVIISGGWLFLAFVICRWEKRRRAEQKEIGTKNLIKWETILGDAFCTATYENPLTDDLARRRRESPEFRLAEALFMTIMSGAPVPITDTTGRKEAARRAFDFLNSVAKDHARCIRMEDAVNTSLFNRPNRLISLNSSRKAFAACVATSTFYEGYVMRYRNLGYTNPALKTERSIVVWSSFFLYNYSVALEEDEELLPLHEAQEPGLSNLKEMVEDVRVAIAL